MSFAACQEPEEQIQVPVNYTLIGDTAFNKDLKANFKVVADKALEQDVNGLMYRRVYLENVVLEAATPTDQSSFKTTISDETGTFPLHVRFKPSQALPKGTKLSFTGTFDVDSSGKLEIRLFKQSEITGMIPPQ